MSPANLPSRDSVAMLDAIRSDLNALDDEILRLVIKRQDLATSVWETKQLMHKPVHDSAQEETKIRRLLSHVPADRSAAVESIFRSLFRLSRQTQYAKSIETEQPWALGRDLQRAVQRELNPRTVACQGTSGSYASHAANTLFPNAHQINICSFEGAARQVHEGQVDAAVLPLENSSAGTVEDVYRLLEKYRLYISNTISIGIGHHLVAIPGATLGSIRRVMSHPQALNQCSALIQGMGWSTESMTNTAFAAREVAHLKDPTVAAIASSKAAESYGLQILMSDLSNENENQTRFAVLTRDPIIRPDAHRMSLLLTASHQTGALNQILSTFTELGINLTKILSRPIPDRTWEYRFYIECDAKYDDPKAYALLFQLAAESPDLRFMGWYREHQQARKDRKR